MNNTLKEYHFTDEQIVFLLQIVRDNAQYEDTEDREWMEDLANQIEDQIVNHPTNSWTQMNRTLSQLKESVERLIEQQGAEASCAAFIFTKEDVFTMDENGEEVYYDEETTNSVLNDLDETDYLLAKAFDCIEDDIRTYQHRNTLNAKWHQLFLLSSLMRIEFQKKFLFKLS